MVAAAFDSSNAAIMSCTSGIVISSWTSSDVSELIPVVCALVSTAVYVGSAAYANSGERTTMPCASTRLLMYALNASRPLAGGTVGLPLLGFNGDPAGSGEGVVLVTNKSPQMGNRLHDHGADFPSISNAVVMQDTPVVKSGSVSPAILSIDFRNTFAKGLKFKRSD